MRGEYSADKALYLQDHGLDETHREQLVDKLAICAETWSTEVGKLLLQGGEQVAQHHFLPHWRVKGLIGGSCLPRLLLLLMLRAAWPFLPPPHSLQENSARDSPMPAAGVSQKSQK